MMQTRKAMLLAIMFGLAGLSAPVFSADGLININTADAKTLEKAIQGIGPARAEAVVVYRGKNGPFKSVDALARVKGIGAITVNRNRDNLTVGEISTP